MALLPFIDETRLLEAVTPREETLTEEERYRNAKRYELLFLASWHPLAPDVFSMAEEGAGLAGEARSLASAPVDPAVHIPRPLTSRSVTENESLQQHIIIIIY